MWAAALPPQPGPKHLRHWCQETSRRWQHALSFTAREGQVIILKALCWNPDNMSGHLLDVICWVFFPFLKKDAYKYQQFNTILEMPKSSPYKQFSLRGHTTKKNRSEVWWKQWIKESSHLRSDFQKTPAFPGVSLGCHPAQHLSNIVIAPLPRRGADSTCCTAGTGKTSRERQAGAGEAPQIRFSHPNAKQSAECSRGLLSGEVQH